MRNALTLTPDLSRVEQRVGQTGLVVDDEEAVRAYIGFTLRRAGFETVEASTGEEALAVLATRKVSAVLLDCMMPGLPWTDVLTKIRSRPDTATLPVVLVT